VTVFLSQSWRGWMLFIRTRCRTGANGVSNGSAQRGRKKWPEPIDFRRKCETLDGPTLHVAYPPQKRRRLVVNNTTNSGVTRRELLKTTGQLAVAAAMA